jgi:uncharacterized protein YcbK (DUF882 family)
MPSELSTNFSRAEFRCPDCGGDTVDYCLVEALELVRSHFIRKFKTDCHIIITSGYRCPAYNDAVGGGINSQHVLGKAADFKVYLTESGKQISPNAIMEYLEQMFHDRYGLGSYDTFTHLDVRDGPARW